jgi:hypothetical protein
MSRKKARIAHKGDYSELILVEPIVLRGKQLMVRAADGVRNQSGIEIRPLYRAKHCH